MQPLSRKLPAIKSLAESASAWLGRLLVLALMIYSPWYYGMVTWDQQVVLFYWTIAIVGSTLLTVLVRRTPLPSTNFLVVVLLLLVGIGFLQTVSLPQPIFDAISPTAKFEQSAAKQASEVLVVEQSEYEKAAKSEGQLETTLSIYPIQTRCSLTIFSSAIAILLCSIILFNDKLSRTALLISLVTNSTAVALLGILQSVSWNSWTLLAMPHPSNFATFVSRNSAPQYLSVGIGCSLALIGVWKKVKDKRREKGYRRRYPATNTVGRVRQTLEDLILELDAVMLILMSVLVTHIVAVVAAASRGGFVALLFSAGVCLLFFLASNRKWIFGGLVGFVAVAVISSMALGLFELDDEITERMQNLESHGRLDLWASSLSQSQYWLTGSGMGTYQFAVVPVNPMKNLWPRHAESIYVEVAVEFGLIGLVLALSALFWLFARLFPTSESTINRMWPAVLYSVLAISVQSFVDFSLIIPAIFLPLLVIIGAFHAESFSRGSDHNSSDQSKHPSRMKRPSSQPEDTSAGPGNRLIPALMILGLVLVSWNGRNSLLGYAQVERLAKWRKQNPNAVTFSLIGDSESSEDTIVDLPNENFDYSHPEVVLELTRIRLAGLESSIRRLPDWPNSSPEAEQKQLSSAEFVSAVLRSNATDPQWLSRKQYFEKYPSISRELSACNSAFEFTAKACRLDWRSAWGRFQTLTSRNSTFDELNWSRINLLCRSISNTCEVLGTCCIIAGDRKMGVESWRLAVERDPIRAAGLSNLLGSLLSVEDVLAILPDHPVAIAQLCRSLTTQSSDNQIANNLLLKIDQDKLFASAVSVSDWELVSWVAESLGNSEGYELSLGKLASLRPFDAVIRFRLAQLLEKRGQIPEAIKQLEQASRRTTLPPQVQNYLNQLRKSAPPNR